MKTSENRDIRYRMPEFEVYPKKLTITTQEERIPTEDMDDCQISAAVERK